MNFVLNSVVVEVDSNSLLSYMILNIIKEVIMNIKNILINIFIVFTVFVLISCSTGIVQIGENKYMIAARSAQAGFGPPVGAKADVYRDANEFCEKQGKTLETADFQMTNSGFARPGTVSLEFMCK